MCSHLSIKITSLHKSNFYRLKELDENLFRLIFETQIHIHIISLFQAIAHSNLLFKSDSYKKYLSAL